MSARAAPRKMPQIELRLVQPADLEVFFEHQSDREACRVAGFTSRDRPAFDAHWKKVLSDPANLVRAVALDGRVVGNVCSFAMPPWRTAGYWIGREWWGQGIATRALQLYLPVEPFRPLHALVSVENLASIRVLEKCNFRRVERLSNPGGPHVGEDFLYVLER